METWPQKIWTTCSAGRYASSSCFRIVFGVKENDYGKEHAMNALEFASTESWLSDEAENAAKTGDAARATYWMRRWSEFCEAFPEFATLCRACRLDVASGVGDGLCDWCAENM